MRTSAGTYSDPSRAGSNGRRPGRQAIPRFVLILAVLLVSCTGGRHLRTAYPGYAVVSWYGPGFHGKLTASGERYDMNSMTCAHRSLPFGTRLKLVNLENGKSAVVVVNDRGPFVRGRDIDVSRAAARKLGITREGTGRVRVTVLGRDMRYAKYLKGGNVGGGRGGRSGTGEYTVQVAAFTERFNAVHMEKGLQLNYGEVYVMERWIDGTRYYRVRVGRFQDEREAGRCAERLADEGYDADVLPYEKQM